MVEKKNRVRVETRRCVVSEGSLYVYKRKNYDIVRVIGAHAHLESPSASHRTSIYTITRLTDDEINDNFVCVSHSEYFRVHSLQVLTDPGAIESRASSEGVDMFADVNAVKRSSRSYNQSWSCNRTVKRARMGRGSSSPRH